MMDRVIDTKADAADDNVTHIRCRPASPQAVQTVLSATIGSDDGRGEWTWFRLPNGDLIFGCFPKGDTYFATEDDHGGL